MQFGISVPNFADYADPRVIAELAYDAEQAGWDGFFVWDHMGYARYYPEPIGDPWTQLAAIAMRTERVRIGPMVTPVARRRPSTLARQCVSLDQLSNGRLIFGAGLGYPADAEFEVFGEEGDARVRARKLDESLAVLAGLWSGQPFTYHGEFQHVDDVTFLPTPVQAHIPVWIAGSWPHGAPFRRAARWDGVFPVVASDVTDEKMSAELAREIFEYVKEQRPAERAGQPYDLVISGYTTGTDRARDAATIAPYAELGVTWWIEGVTNFRGPFDAMQARVRSGPPR